MRAFFYALVILTPHFFLILSHKYFLRLSIISVGRFFRVVFCVFLSLPVIVMRSLVTWKINSKVAPGSGVAFFLHKANDKLEYSVQTGLFPVIKCRNRQLMNTC